MAQLNIEADNDLYKRVKMACIEDETNLKKWVSTALEIALDFDQIAMTRCRELGWAPEAQEPIEVIEESAQETLPSKPNSVKKSQ